MAGFAIGVAIGSVIPGAGTVVGGIIGSVISVVGGMIGSSLGKKLATTITGPSELEIAKKEMAVAQQTQHVKQAQQVQANVAQSQVQPQAVNFGSNSGIQNPISSQYSQYAMMPASNPFMD